MGKWGDNYEKTELVQIAEKLYTSKEELRVFKFDLNSVEFREKYLAKRTERLKERVIIYALLILLCIVLLSFFGYATGKLNTALGGLAGIFAYAMVAVVICLIGLAIKEVQFLYLLVIDKKTIRKQQQEVSQCIETLKEKINIATEKITRLENRRKELLEEQEKTGQEQETDTEQVLEEDGAAFHLRKTGQTEAVDVSQLLEYYEKEESYLYDRIRYIDEKIEHMNRQIVQVEDGFDLCKKRVGVMLLVMLFLALIQGAFKGLSGTVTSIFCFIVMLGYFFYLEKVCKKQLLDYLVEHENYFVKDYAFCNDLQPLSVQRNELIEEKQQIEKELIQIKQERMNSYENITS